MEIGIDLRDNTYCNYTFKRNKMFNFIKLTLADAIVGSDVIYINPANIIYIRESNNSRIICVNNNMSNIIMVKESINDILNKL